MAQRGSPCSWQASRRGRPRCLWYRTTVRQTYTFCSILYLADSVHHHSDHGNIHKINPVRMERPSAKGRPMKTVDEAWLREVLSPRRKISISRTARLLGMHRHTVRKNMKAYGLRYTYTVISDDDLDTIVRAYRHRKPGSGVRYLVGFLRSQGLRIQKTRISASLRRVDQLGRILRQRHTIQRRKYKSSRPNAVWHCDGHHKLILWGIVIHGFIDGYCRTV